MGVLIFWFRRDLRIEENIALYNSLNQGIPVIPIFIFDKEIVDELDESDARLNFIYDRLERINKFLSSHNSSVRIFKNSVTNVIQELLQEYDVEGFYVNEDYEPYAFDRDQRVASLLALNGIKLHSYTDHVVFKPGTIFKDDGLPYTVYTPFKNKWLKHFEANPFELLTEPNYNNFSKTTFNFPRLSDLGLKKSTITVADYNIEELSNYEITRDVPSLNATSFLGPHLRFGTVSVRTIISKLKSSDAVFLSELIWREFFIQIMVHFPKVVNENFKAKYNGIIWRNNEEEFEMWCKGETGYPIVDAGMRQLNQTGYMHNRVRMITASFLCKHLLIDWRWGEAYFAEKLLDYELASNNGNWQWVAGTGCDAAPYFRVFSPSAQTLKFDTELKYVKAWVPELNEISYKPMVDHKIARERALLTYKTGLGNIPT
ncbi:DNA photolyase family protein [Vicingaceae bacterium]|nr:DNA photolyase family protein [Vicingaceae bacterium]